MEDISLVIFTKRPILNSGKQRLLSQFTNHQVLKIAELLLECSLEDARNWSGKVVFAVANNCDLSWAESLMLGQDSICMTQGGKGNLGTRIHYVDEYLTKRGHVKKIIIGTDAPAMTMEMLHSAADSLGQNRFVFIPSRDGGVTLMGNVSPWPNLEKLPWCSATLGPELVEVCTQDGPVQLLSESFDIDLPCDLAHLQKQCSTDDRPSRKRILNWLENCPEAKKNTFLE